MGRFIEVAAGVDPPAGLTEAVHTQTEGNPLFVTEVVRLLVQEGALSPDPSPRGRGETGGRGEGDSWTVRIPEGVREVIGRRLNRLSQRCNETLTIASVIGREFELRQLTPLVEDISEDRLLEVLEEALSARVIEELPQAVGRYQFTHALIQETLTEELTLTRRVRLHARIAETLEELYGDSAEVHAAELAHHFAEAEAVLGADRLVHYSLLAGERALAAYAWEEAMGHFRRGLAAKEGQSVDAETAKLLFGLGRAEASTLQRGPSGSLLSSLERAFDYYAEIGDVTWALVVALEQPGPPLVRSPEVTPFLARALALAPEGSHQAGQLLSRYGNQLGVVEGDFEAARQAFDQALEIARREGDITLEMGCLVNACRVAGHNCHWQECLQLSEQAIQLASQVKAPLLEVPAYMWACQAATVLGDLERTKNHAQAALAPAESSRHRAMLAIALGIKEQVARMEGDFDLARELATGALDVSPQDELAFDMRILSEAQVGNLALIDEYLNQSIKWTVDPRGIFLGIRPLTIVLTWYMTGLSTLLEIAEQEARTVVSSQAVPVYSRFLMMITLGLIAAGRGDREEVRELYNTIKETRGANYLGLMADDRLLGILSHAMGELEQAAGHFEDALTFCRKGFRPELAWTCCDYADTLLQRNEPGDRAKAMSLLDESLAISSELGMRPLMERVLSRREILRA